MHRNFPSVAGKYFYKLPYEKIFGDWINEWKNDNSVKIDSFSYDDSTNDHYYIGRIMDFQPFDIKADRIDFTIRKTDWTINSPLPYQEGTFSLQLVFHFSGDSSDKLIKALVKKIDKEFLKCTDRKLEQKGSDSEFMKDLGTFYYFNRQENVPILKMRRGETKRMAHQVISMQLDFSVE